MKTTFLDVESPTFNYKPYDEQSVGRSWFFVYKHQSLCFDCYYL